MKTPTIHQPGKARKRQCKIETDLITLRSRKRMLDAMIARNPRSRYATENRDEVAAQIARLESGLAFIQAVR